MTTTFTNLVKNASTFANDVMSGIVGYITTDTPDYILVGSTEAEFLVWSDITLWVNEIKN